MGIREPVIGDHLGGMKAVTPTPLDPPPGRWHVMRFKDDPQMLHVLHTAHGKATTWLNEQDGRFQLRDFAATETTVTIVVTI